MLYKASIIWSGTLSTAKPGPALLEPSLSKPILSEQPAEPAEPDHPDTVQSLDDLVRTSFNSRETRICRPLNYPTSRSSENSLWNLTTPSPPESFDYPSRNCYHEQNQDKLAKPLYQSHEQQPES